MKHDKEIAIAAALGWELETHSTSDGDTFIAFTVYGSRTGPFLAKFYMVDDSHVVAYAAYAKAEMAKRGWDIVPIYAQHEFWALPKWCMRAWKGAGDVICIFNDFSPSCVISEANALIDAIYAALEMETTT